MKLAIVISQFPCNDEVFILRELRALQRRGLDLQIHSIKEPSEAPLHADAAPLIGAARYSPFLLSRKVIERNLQLLSREPLLYGRLLGKIVKENWRSKPFLWRSLAVFPKAVRWGMDLRDEPAERIHAHWATHPSTAGWVMSEISKIPLSLTAHAHDIYLDQAMLAFKLREAVAVLTCTRQNLAFLEALAPDLPAGRIQLSYHGLDLDVYKPAEVPSETFRILSVGTLLPRKGFDTLVEACGILEREGIAFECNIVGDGPMRPELEKRAAALGLKTTKFLGKQSQEKLPAIYRRSSVFVLAAVHGDQGGGTAKKPSASDLIHFGIPNVILEAMACGLPVVTTRMPALVEVLVDGENSLYVAERDPAALAAALRSLATDPARRSTLGGRAVERIRAGFDIQITSGEVAAALGFERTASANGSAHAR
ncbi:MAG: glycosyltransferase, group 1 family protein [Labilithrix sp.]|nr:glycosyltransferase, group 1 family protein [Labilithrix sp.]